MSYITEKISATEVKVITTSEKIFEIDKLKEQLKGLQGQIITLDEQYLKRKQELVDRIAYLKDLIK